MSWDYFQNDSHIFSVEAGVEGNLKGQDARLFASPGDFGLGQCWIPVMVFDMYTLCIEALGPLWGIYFQGYMLENF